MYDWYMNGVAEINKFRDALKIVEDKKEIAPESDFSKKVREVVRKKILEKIEAKKVSNRARMNETMKKLKD